MHTTGNVNTFVAALQRQAGLPVEPTRTYAERSVEWLGWYLGPVAVSLAAIGAGLLVARWIRRPDAIATLTLAVAGAGSALYLWKPSISPDQIWAMRRYVPAAMPLTMLLAGLGLALVADAVARRSNFAATVVLTAGALGLVIPAAIVTWPVRNFVPGPGDSNVNLAGVEATCRATGRHAAILTAYNDFGTQELIGPLRAWCEVPVAYMTRPFTEAEISHLAALWKSEGRDLWVIGSTSQAVVSSAPPVTPELIALTILPRELETTINRAPSHYAVVTARVYGGRAIP
jgi:hypothetical protein